MVTYANSTVSNGDVTVNEVVASISIDMTVIIVTTSAATLDYGIVVEVAIVLVAMHEIAAATRSPSHGSSNHSDSCSLTSRSQVRSQDHHGPRDHIRDGRNVRDRDEHPYSPEWFHSRSRFKGPASST
jgi:hypothetical protein